MKNRIQAFILILCVAGLGVVYYYFNPASSDSIFPSCPTYTIFGIYCPGCGTQRSLHYLIHGKVMAAMRYNPLFVIMLPFIIALVIHYLIPKFSDKHWDFKLIRNNTFLYFLFSVIVLYFLLRNIPSPIFDILRPLDEAL